MALAGGGFLREVLALGMTGVVVRVALEAGAAGVVFEEEVERVVCGSPPVHYWMA